MSILDFVLRLRAALLMGAVVGLSGRLYLCRKKINLAPVLAGQAVGIKEVDDGIWLVSFIDYDLGYIGNSAAPRQSLWAKSVT
jgi:hypothetical protein